MPRVVARNTLYDGPAFTLCVEDELTKAYLSALWNDPGVKFLVGGGRNGVGWNLIGAEEAGSGNVFGVVDRDFDKTNYAKWFDLNCNIRRFILPRHEIENYLLDTLALSACRSNTKHLTAAEIDAFLMAEAGSRCWWGACRDVVSHIKNRFFDQFMPHPKTPQVGSEASAIEHIENSDWFRALPRKSSGMTIDRVHRLLKRSYSRSLRRVADGSWRDDFPGKELLREIGNRISDRASSPKFFRRTLAEFEVDIAKEIAAWQVDQSAIPSDLSDLLNALKLRVS